MTNKSPTIKETIGAILFASLFLLSGLGVTIFFAVMPMARLANSSSWIECEAIIDPASVELKESRGSKGGSTYKVQASYNYTAPDGSAQSSDRVAFSSGSDNIGSWQRRAYRKLKEMSRDKTICHVNPKNMGDAVLLREVHELSVIFCSIFGFVFVCAGAHMMSGAVRERLAGKKKRDRTVTVRPTSLSSAEDIFIAALPVCLNLWLLFMFVTKAPDASEWIWLLLIPVIAPILFVSYGLMIRRNFGEAKFTTAKKIRIGSELSGAIEIKNGKSGENFEIKIKCARSETTGSGKGRKTRITTLWKSKEIIPQIENNGDSISLRFVTNIPHILLEPNAADNPNVQWTLTLKAKDRMLANRISFLLNVYRPENKALPETLDCDMETFCDTKDGKILLTLNNIEMNTTSSGALEIVFPSKNIPVKKDIAMAKLGSFCSLCFPIIFVAFAFGHFVLRTGIQPKNLPTPLLLFFAIFIIAPTLIGIFSCRAILRDIRKKYAVRVLVIDRKRGAELCTELDGKRKKIATIHDIANLKINNANGKGKSTESLHIHPRSSSVILLAENLRAPEYAEALGAFLTESIRLQKDSPQ